MNWEGVWFIDGKVSKVTPEGVEVFVPNGHHACDSPHTWRFDSKGEALEQYWDGGTSPIDDMPFEERKIQIEEFERRWQTPDYYEQHNPSYSRGPVWLH